MTYTFQVLTLTLVPAHRDNESLIRFNNLCWAGIEVPLGTLADKEERCPSADEWIRKLWYIYTMEYYSAIKKNTFESVLMRWMKLEPIIQSEVSQKEKHRYNILTHIYGI